MIKQYPCLRPTIETNPAGPFAGPMVVSMRAIDRDKVALVTEISGQFPMAHGKPVHTGNPDIGINDVMRLIGVIRPR